MPKRPEASTAIVMIAMEMLAVALFVLLAGISDKFGKAMVIVMSGFWLLALLMNPRAPLDLANAIVVLVYDPSDTKTSFNQDNSGLLWPSGVYNPSTGQTPK